MKNNRKPTVGLYTLGCKVSQYETEAVAEAFSRLGFEVCPFDTPCDAYVINTCTVTAESDRKSRQVIRRAMRRSPDAVIAVMGCYSQRAPGEVAAIPGVSVVVGTNGKTTVPHRVLDLLSGRGEVGVFVDSLDGAKFEPMCVVGSPRTRAYLKIEDGCEAKCSYCAISAARGPVRSKRREDVISEVEGLAAGGIREIVLTGIETGSYGRDFDEKYDLADLISELDERGSCRRIRLGSLAPELAGEGFASRVRGKKILAPHFHLSVQSGSDAVLRRMRRRYTRAMALDAIRRLREYFPGAQFTTDLMVGFPGEREEDFLATLDFVREAGLIDAHVFAYSRRAGTDAAVMPDQVPEEIKRERSAALIAEKNRVRDGILDRIVKEGQPLDAILEVMGQGGAYSAHSASFIELSVLGEGGAELPSGLGGSEVRVTPVSHSGGIVNAWIINNCK